MLLNIGYQATVDLGSDNSVKSDYRFSPDITLLTFRLKLASLNPSVDISQTPSMQRAKHRNRPTVIIRLLAAALIFF